MRALGVRIEDEAILYPFGHDPDRAVIGIAVVDAVPENVFIEQRIAERPAIERLRADDDLLQVGDDVLPMGQVRVEGVGIVAQGLSLM